MSVNERIANLMEFKRLNKNQMAAKVGVAPTVIGNIVGGRLSNPSYDLLIKILESFDDVSAEWLLRSNGEMIRGSHIDNSNIRTSETEPIYDKKVHCANCEANERLISHLTKENERLWKLLERTDKQETRKGA